MQRLEVSGEVRLKYKSLGVKGLNNRNALWHVKICHDAKVVSWLLTEMTTTSSEVEDVEVTVKTVRVSD